MSPSTGGSTELVFPGFVGGVEGRLGRSTLWVVGPEPPPSQFRLVIFWPLAQCQGPPLTCQLLADDEAGTAPQGGREREEEVDIVHRFSVRAQQLGLGSGELH